ncbi:MAG: MMOB1640 family gliding machinery internal complex protein [Metamycoplasmataceae bacterium]
MSKNLIVTTTINPDLLLKIYNSSVEELVKVVVLTLDYKPIELFNNRNQKSQRTNKLSMFDVAGLIVTTIKNPDDEISKPIKTKKMILAQDVSLLTENDVDLLCLGGTFDILPNELILEKYKNIKEIKNTTLEELDKFLELPKNESSIKAYLKLTDYFSVKNYFNNNNVLKLLDHKSEALNVAKKTLIKSIIAWQIRK